jgi:hypothetical protein
MTPLLGLLVCLVLYPLAAVVGCILTPFAVGILTMGDK